MIIIPKKPKYPTLRKDYIERRKDYRKFGEVLKLPSTYKMFKVSGKMRRYRLVHFGGITDAKRLVKEVKKDGYNARKVKHDAGLIATLVYIRKKGR